jgi:hypothetical protein
MKDKVLHNSTESARMVAVFGDKALVIQHNKFGTRVLFNDIADIAALLL